MYCIVLRCTFYLCLYDDRAILQDSFPWRIVGLESNIRSFYFPNRTFCQCGFACAFCLFAVLIQAAAEELESRVFFFGKLKEGGFGFLPAAILSGMYFSYLHATNPSFGIIPFISIALAGVVYLLIYVYTGSIWAACGLHQLWNVSQDFIFGLPNSGNPSGMSILSSTANGSSFFYNADFGVEGSIWCIIVHLVAAVILLVLIKKKGIKQVFPVHDDII